jgi:predicted RNase H-like HicB family nuclease
VESRYEIDIFWSEEDEAYIAVVPDLPYCSAWGETREEALAQVQDAIRGHIKVRQKHGDPIPEPTLHTATH